MWDWVWFVPDSWTESENRWKIQEQPEALKNKMVAASESGKAFKASERFEIRHSKKSTSAKESMSGQPSSP